MRLAGFVVTADYDAVSTVISYQHEALIWLLPPVYPADLLMLSMMRTISEAEAYFSFTISTSSSPAWSTRLNDFYQTVYYGSAAREHHHVRRVVAHHITAASLVVQLTKDWRQLSYRYVVYTGDNACDHFITVKRCAFNYWDVGCFSVFGA